MRTRMSWKWARDRGGSRLSSPDWERWSDTAALSAICSTNGVGPWKSCYGL